MRSVEEILCIIAELLIYPIKYLNESLLPSNLDNTIFLISALLIVIYSLHLLKMFLVIYFSNINRKSILLVPFVILHKDCYVKKS